MYRIELGVAANGCEGLVRESLVELSSLYREARDAIANPTASWDSGCSLPTVRVTSSSSETALGCQTTESLDLRTI